MTKTEVFNLRLTQADRAALEEFAALSSQTMSETIRSLLRAALFMVSQSSDAELEAASNQTQTAAGNMA